MTDKQIRDRIVGALSVSMMPMEMEAECVRFLDRCIAKDKKTPGKWIPVEEGLPAMFKPVLVCRAKEKDAWQEEQGYRDVNGWWKVYGTRTKKVTHWMPLPEPPKEVPEYA